MFVGLHAVLAMRTATPELEISEDEGKEFTARVQSVMRHYSVRTTQKTMDWVALVGCMTAIYAPRMVAIRLRKQAEKAEAKKTNQSGTVFDMNGRAFDLGAAE